MKISDIVVILLVALQLMPVIMPSGRADTRNDARPGPMGNNSELLWNDEYSDFSKTAEKRDTLYISNGKVMVGNATVAEASDPHTVVLFHFEEGSGTKAVDSGPNHKNGTLTNMDPATDWVSGINGTGLDFDGVDDYVLLPSSTVYNVKNVTVEAWVYSRFVQPYSDKYVLCKRNGYYMLDHGFTIDTPTVVTARNTMLKTGHWYYLAGSYDGATVRFYVNGTQVAATATGAGMSHWTTNLYIGAGFSGIYPFDGMIDEVRVSDTARSAKEIKDEWLNYQAQLKGYRTPHTRLLTERITITANHDWEELNVVKNTPANTSINVTVIDNVTGDPVFGYTNLSDTKIDLSGIDPLTHPSIQLEVDFSVDNSTATPELDSMNITCIRKNTPPILKNMITTGIVRSPGSIPIYFDIVDYEQPASTLNVSVWTAKYPNGTYDTANLEDLHFDAKSMYWAVNFTAGPATAVGLYSLKVKIVDDMDYKLTVIWEGKLTVYNDPGTSVELAPKNLTILRGSEGLLTVLPHLGGALTDVNLTVKAFKAGARVNWIGAPVLTAGHFAVRVDPPLTAVLGGYDVQVSAFDPATYKYLNTTIKDAFFVKNNAPRLNITKPFAMDEDAKATFDLKPYVEDRDTAVPFITIGLAGSSLGASATLGVSNYKLSVLALPKDWAGSFDVTLNISDGIDSVLGNATVVVNQTADMPVLDHVGDMSGYEDTTLYHNFTATDPDPGTSFMYSLDLGMTKALLDNDSGYYFNIYTGRLVLPLTNDMVGPHACTISVSDGLFAVQQPFVLTVINVNDPPVWSAVPNDAVRPLGQTATFDISATDIDKGDVISYSISSIPSTDIKIEARSGHITYLPKSIGIFFINISATDGLASIQHEFKLEVRRPGANALPEATLIGPEDGAKVDLVNPLFEWTVTDPDSTNVTSNVYIGTDLHGVSHLDTKYLVEKGQSSRRFIPVQFLEKGRTYYWTVIPVDQSSFGSCKNGVWSFTVSDTARTNHAPVIEHLDPITVTTGKTVNLNIKANDEDGDVLTYLLEGQPAGMTISSAGLISWTPSKDQVGEHIMTVDVSDGKYHTTTQFDVTVKKKETPLTHIGLDTMMFGIIAAIVIAVILILVAVMAMRGKRRVGPEVALKEEKAEGPERPHKAAPSRDGEKPKADEPEKKEVEPKVATKVKEEIDLEDLEDED